MGYNLNILQKLFLSALECHVTQLSTFSTIYLWHISGRKLESSGDSIEGSLVLLRVSGAKLRWGCCEGGRRPGEVLGRSVDKGRLTSVEVFVLLVVQVVPLSLLHLSLLFFWRQVINFIPWLLFFATLFEERVLRLVVNYETFSLHSIQILFKNSLLFSVAQPPLDTLAT